MIFFCNVKPESSYLVSFIISLIMWITRRVGLSQLVIFLVVELTHPSSNPRFGMSVTFTANYSFSGM
jgi:hypothetical protein